MPAPHAQPLDAAQAERFRQALGLLQSGQRVQALALAETISGHAPYAADAWHLLGMCLADNDRQDEANSAFERALALLPGNAMISRNFGLSLARHGKALRAQGRLEAAEPVLRKALVLSPEQASAWVDLGAVLRLLGRIEEALAAFRRAEAMLDQRGASTLELQDAINGVLVDAGRPAEALARARRLVALHPDHVPSHETLGNLLWEYGADLAPGEDPLDGLRAAAQAQPDHRDLQLALARMLVTTKRADQALALLQPLRRREPGDGLLDWYAADALDALQQYGEAAALYASAARSGLGGMPDFLNARARNAFRTGRFDLAADCAGEAVRLDPRNQEGWSHLGTAWRLAGDEREHWLCDYERLVGYVEVASPPASGDPAAFLQALAVTLEGMHGAKREPVNQSVRGGTQTAGQLFGRDDAIIRSTEVALRTAVEDWLTTLPDDPAHPFLSRKQRSVGFVGSWSVRLQSSGRHSNHIHPRGWASSAFYVALPGSVLASDAESRAGWIQFGQPLEELGLDLPPRRVIQPRPGHLALFPSYLWHGTVPFDSPESRLTVAFDMQPKA